MSNTPVPLNQLDNKAQATIASLRGGHNLTRRLAPLGFTPGAPLTVVQNYGHGPIIVQIRDARIALGRGEANKILVYPQGETS